MVFHARMFDRNHAVTTQDLYLEWPPELVQRQSRQLRLGEETKNTMAKDLSQ